MDISEIPKVTGTPSAFPRMLYKLGCVPTKVNNEAEMEKMLQDGWLKKRPDAPVVAESAPTASDGDRIAALERRISALEQRTSGPAFPTTAGKKFADQKAS